MWQKFLKIIYGRFLTYFTIHLSELSLTFDAT
jgi:hypothetical protein